MTKFPMRDMHYPVYYHCPDDSDWDAHLVMRETISRPCECCGVGEYVYKDLPESEWYWAPMNRIVDMSDLLCLADEKQTLFEVIASLGKQVGK